MDEPRATWSGKPAFSARSTPPTTRGRGSGLLIHGASYKLFMLLDSDKFEFNLSVPLAMEYEEASKRLVGKIPLKTRDIDDILDYIFSIANRRKVHYLWRPFLRDPKDDMVLELAVSAGCEIIVTYNKIDFQGAEQFGIRVMTPQQFLQRIGEKP